MKLNEVLYMGGFTQMVGPGTFISNQVVQPRTVQANEPDQAGEEFEKAKNKQKEQPKIDSDEYNRKIADVLTNYFDGDARIEDLAKMVDTTFFALKKDPQIKLSKNYTEFAKKIKKEV